MAGDSTRMGESGVLQVQEVLQYRVTLTITVSATDPEEACKRAASAFVARAAQAPLPEFARDPEWHASLLREPPA